MIKKFKIAYKELQDNRGSGLAVVMIAMVLLSLMATTLLNMTYIGYRVKAEDMQQKKDYYVISTEMDEIRAEVQNVVSRNIEIAYESALVGDPEEPKDTEEIDYIDISTLEGQEELEKNFQKEFFEKIAADDWIKIYESTLVETESENQEGENITTTEFVLQNISLTYENSKNNTITVKTDIVIKAPSLYSDEWDFDELVQYRNWTII